ncbi:MAG TPA: type II secretion system protein E [Chloroflexi bacterium]|nr:type II secretion system protein E [Chloroflexota bacterium]
MMNAVQSLAIPSTNGAGRDRIQLKIWLAERIQSSMSNTGKLTRSPEIVQIAYERFKQACQYAKINLPPEKEDVFFNEVLDEIVGLGPLEQLMRDEFVSDIMVNGPKMIFVEKRGKIEEVSAEFADDAHVLRVINKIVEPLGRQVNATSPTVDARLPDGSRVNAVIPPCAIDGPTIAIRKFAKERLEIKDLINYGSLNQVMADYLQACVVSKLNIVVSGGTGSGKTTLLNVLSSFIPEKDRIITIEDAAELSLNQRHVVRLETKTPSHEGDSVVTIRNLLINSLRMRPDRIVVGECRGGEALDMLQAMNTGHDGSMTTIHANSPRDSLSRLETLVLMAGMDLPIQTVRKQIASAINLVVQLSRMRDGTRKIIQVTEIAGTEGDTIVMQDLFKFVDQGEKNGKVLGEFEPGGLRSQYTDRLKIYGFNLSPKTFMKTMPSTNGDTRRR